jgi:hypothetical protein
VDPLGFEPRTRGLRVRCSGQTELEVQMVARIGFEPTSSVYDPGIPGRARGALATELPRHQLPALVSNQVCPELTARRSTFELAGIGDAPGARSPC